MDSFLKEILEDTDITKIMHNCRMDSDALHAELHIKLAGVHDTQACDMLLSGTSMEKNLNRLLMAYDCRINLVRNNSIYNAI